MFRNPWFGLETISQDTIKSFNINFNDLIINYINRGYYIWISKINEYFVPNRSAYLKFNNEHDILVFGYNDNNETYNVIGYDDKGIYNSTCINFKQLKESFFSVDNTDLVFMLLNKDYVHDFNIDNVIQLLSDYLYSKNTSERFNILGKKADFDKFVFGLQTYDCLKNYFELCMNKEVKEDIRSLHFLQEHKNCMIMRINFLKQNGYLKNSESMLNDYKKYIMKFV